MNTLIIISIIALCILVSPFVYFLFKAWIEICETIIIKINDFVMEWLGW